MFAIKKLLDEEVGQSEWSSIYLILVFAIAALLLITLIKPFFRSASTLSKPIVQKAG
jgi:membrane protein implicated in regulation of membrane protease activity